MLCACAGDHFNADDGPQSPESLATRDFSASCLSSRNGGGWESELEGTKGDEDNYALKDVLSLNYEEARALLGRLEYQRNNYEAALEVFRGIDIKSVRSLMVKAISERNQRKNPRAKGDIAPARMMSMHSVKLLLEAIVLKAKSLDELGHHIDAAKECSVVLDIIEAALPNGLRNGVFGASKMEEIIHSALELLPNLWTKAGLLDKAIEAYRRILVKPWNMESKKIAKVQKTLASLLLYGAVEANLPPRLQLWGAASPLNNIEEAILLLLVLMEKAACGELVCDEETMDHMTFACSITGQFDLLSKHFELALPGGHDQTEKWYSLALSYSAAGQSGTALNLLEKASRFPESHHVPSLLLGAKLSSQLPDKAQTGINLVRKISYLVDEEHHVMIQARLFLGICYSNAARTSTSDSERKSLHKKSMNHLTFAAGRRSASDPALARAICVEHLQQRNLEDALKYAMLYHKMICEYSLEGLQLLAYALSAEQNFKDAESLLELALDDAGREQQIEILRFKAALQVSAKQPKKAMDTLRVLLSLLLILQSNEDQANSSASKETNAELAAWQDLAAIYTEFRSWENAEACTEKAKMVDFYSPRNWHLAGLSFEARSNTKEAMVAFAVSLSVEPDYVPSIVSMAGIFMRSGGRCLPIARSLLRNAVRLEPKNHEALRKLGLVSKMEGSLQLAADIFQAAYELQLSSPLAGTCFSV